MESLPLTSADIEPFSIVKIYEPSSNATAPNRYIALVGGRSRNITVFPASSLSTNSIIFQNCNPPNDGTILEKKVYLRVRINIKFSGTSTNGNLLKKGRD